MRDEDLEEKAYKRYLRSKKKDSENKVQKMLNQHNARCSQFLRCLACNNVAHIKLEYVYLTYNIPKQSLAINVNRLLRRQISACGFKNL